MAANMQFDQPKYMFQEINRFKHHVKFIFKGPLSKASNMDKSGWLGMWIGRQGREVYKILEWTEWEEDIPDSIIEKLENYVRPRKNMKIARFQFLQRKQRNDEHFDNFVKDLDLVLMDCEYSTPDDILIDAIISEVAHIKVQERLLDQGQNLTLAKSIDIGRQLEISKQQLPMIRCEETKVSSIIETGSRYSSGKFPRKIKVRSDYRRENSGNLSKPSATCDNCGLEPSKSHTLGKCPDKGTTCNYCKKENHWLQACIKRKTRQINSLQDEYTDSSAQLSEEDMLYIHTVEETEQMGTIGKSSDKWIVTLNIENNPINFRIDTGAKCSIIVKSELDKLGIDHNLQQSLKILRSYSNNKIRPAGSVKLPVTHIDRKIDCECLVVDIKQENVISGEVAEDLGLVVRVNMNDEHEDKNGVRRLLGLVQYLAKFIPDMSHVDVPQRSLLKSDVPFSWDHEHQDSSDRLKMLHSKHPVLVYFDVNKLVEIQCDASQHGLCAVLIQEGKPFAFSSSSVTETEKRYAQIEKGMFSIVTFNHKVPLLYLRQRNHSLHRPQTSGGHL